MGQFVTDEIVLPNGPREGRRFRYDYQPYTRLLYDAIDRRCWSEVVITGPTQSGKTLSAFVNPICYHLFEIQETVGVGVPSLDLVADKWREDILPVIERTRYRDMLPLKGGGSRGGRVAAIRFRNGRTLRWFTGGGNDKSRAAFTTRVLIVTETDGFDVASESSREATKIVQLEGRTRAYQKYGRLIYKEGTVSIANGHTWQRYGAGTRSQISTRCPHCLVFSAMEREQLVGWEAAESESAARAAAHWCCPACGATISESERIEANRQAVLVHAGQEVTPEGQVTGPPAPTKTLGFRWSAYHNLFTDAAELAAEEWRAKQAADPENAEKALRQFTWCLPWEPQIMDGDPLDHRELQKRLGRFGHRVIPADTVHLTLAIDPGKWHGWYLLLAFRANGQIHIPDYELFDVNSKNLKEEVALLIALRSFRDEVVNAGWPIEGTQKTRCPDMVWVDAGHLPAIVHQVCLEAGTYPTGNWFATRGLGATTMEKQAFHAPKRTTNEIRKIGDGWFISRQQQYRSWVVSVNSDAWILWFQNCLRLPLTDADGNATPGAVTLFDPGPSRALAKTHNDLCRHFANEQLKTEMVEGRGIVQTWETHGRHDHLDCAKLAAAAGNYLGYTITGTAPPSATPTVNDWLAARRRG